MQLLPLNDILTRHLLLLIACILYLTKGAVVKPALECLKCDHVTCKTPSLWERKTMALNRPCAVCTKIVSQDGSTLRSCSSTRDEREPDCSSPSLVAPYRCACTTDLCNGDGEPENQRATLDPTDTNSAAAAILSPLSTVFLGSSILLTTVVTTVLAALRQ